MFDSIHKRIFRKIKAIRRCFAQTAGLPFNEILSTETIPDIMAEEVDAYRDRIFSPLIALSAFLSQVLSSDQSCNNAKALVIAERVAQGEAPGSSNNRSYCNARRRCMKALSRD